MEQKFYRCSHCGKIIAVVKETGVPVICCGEKMQEIVPNTVDAAQEKHVPVIEVKENLVTVKVGSVTHPMLDEHYIEIRRASYNERFIILIMITEVAE